MPGKMKVQDAIWGEVGEGQEEILPNPTSIHTHTHTPTC